MPDPSGLVSRKSDHIRINLEEDVNSSLTSGFERYHYVHRALPELNLSEVDTSLTLFNKKLAAPLLISSMTGGTSEAALINERLAWAAEKAGVAMGVGSQRVGIEHPELADTFKVRQVAPKILLFANLGAVQLNYQYTLKHCQQAVDMIEADGLILHLNPLQEALQLEGDTNFSGLVGKIEKVCRALPVPVIVKEVGWGISEEDARLLRSAGVSAIDVAGAGGTSWSQVEMYRLQEPNFIRVAASFRNWGIPTSESIQMARRGAADISIFSTGGMKNGLDVAKAITLGADLGGMAGPFLKAAVISQEEVLALISALIQQIRIVMFVVAARNLSDLRRANLQKE